MDPNSAEAKHLLAFIERIDTLTVGALHAALDQVELWRPINGWRYAVSSWGGVQHQGNSVRLQPAVTAGYPHVTLAEGDKRASVRIHRLVAVAFLGPPPFAFAQVAHNDGDPANCRVGNLRWATGSDNQADSIDRS